MNKKIKILQVIGSLEMGGAENVAMNVVRYIDKKKFQCDYLVFGNIVGEYEEEAKRLGSTIIRIPQPKDNYIKYYKNIKKVLKNGEYDVVHSHALLNNGIVLKAAHKVNVKKRISHSHSTTSGYNENIFYKVYKKIMKKMIKIYATNIIACGKDAGEFLYGKNYFNLKGEIINNGLDIEVFNYNAEKRNLVRKQLGLENKLVIGHIGRLAAVKNHDFLIDVFKKVSQLNGKSILLIVGDGELKKKLEDKVKKLSLEDRVIFTGAMPNVSSILQAMDLFVFPSLYEGLPLTLIEAQASGIRCLVSENITDQIKVTNLINFMSLDKVCIDDWAKKIVSMSSYERNTHSEELKAKGFDINTIIKEIEDIYKI